jgi:hypothetical protein
LLAATEAHIADAKVKQISAATRFSAAYTAIRMLAEWRCMLMAIAR